MFTVLTPIHINNVRLTRMNADQLKNIEQAIDTLCDNLVWTWGYYRSLNTLHNLAKTTPASLDPFPEFVSCLYYGYFDLLFIKINHFIDPTKGACGLPRLFKILRSYAPDETLLLEQIKKDEKRLKRKASLDKIKKWRNQISAHLTLSNNNPEFFNQNRLHLKQIEAIIKTLEEIVGYYSKIFLGRVNSMRNPSKKITREVKSLFSGKPNKPIQRPGLRHDR